MNSSIQNSFNDGSKGYSSRHYRDERLPVVAEMLGKTTEIFNKEMERSGDITDMTQLGINYRGSSIIGEDNIRDTTLGVSGYNKDSETAAEVSSLINATSEHKCETLFGIFSPSHHSVLVVTKEHEKHSALALLSTDCLRSILIVPSESNVNELGTVYDKAFIDSGGLAAATSLILLS